MNHNATSYPFDFVHVVVFVDAQGLYRHMLFAVGTLPNIAETTGGNWMLAKYLDLFTGDSVRIGEEFPPAAKLPKPL